MIRHFQFSLVQVNYRGTHELIVLCGLTANLGARLEVLGRPVGGAWDLSSELSSRSMRYSLRPRNYPRRGEFARVSWHPKNSTGTDTVTSLKKQGLGHQDP